MVPRESDPSIVVGDGRADHRAKGWAGEQSWQSTHAGARKAPQQSVSRSLLALRQKAVAEPKHRFRSLYRMIKCLNRRSQRRSYNWMGFEALWRTLGIPAPRIVEGPCQPQCHLRLP